MKYVSGGHLNPVVSLAGAISGHISWLVGLVYVAAQVRVSTMHLSAHFHPAYQPHRWENGWSRWCKCTGSSTYTSSVVWYRSYPAALA